MSYRPKKFNRQKGFSLTEVMMAAGILAIGFMLVAGTFPVGVKLTTVATERTVAAVAGQEAFGKLKLFADDAFDFSQWPIKNGDFWRSTSELTSSQLEVKNFADVKDDTDFIDEEFLYPSVDGLQSQDKRYSWTAVCRYLGSGQLQFAVFVNRLASAGAVYPDPSDPDNPSKSVDYPQPLKIKRDTAVGGVSREIIIDTADAELTAFLTDESYLVGMEVDSGGDPVSDKFIIMTVVDKQKVTDAESYGRRLVLAEEADLSALSQELWFIPTAWGSDRNPCISVVQEKLSF